MLIISRIIIFLLFAMMFTDCSHTSESHQQVSDSLTTRALDELRRNLVALPAWEKVHAAEYLLWVGYPDGVREEFLREEEKYGTQFPYRIGIWRVLAQSAMDDEERQKYVDKIRAAFRDEAGQDRLHAVETLAKLGVPLLETEKESTEEVLRGEKNSMYIYTLWGASINSPRYESQYKAELIGLVANKQTGEIQKLQAAYALKNLRGLSKGEWEVLANAALEESPGSVARTYMLSSAFMNSEPGTESPLKRKLYEALLECRNAAQKGPRMELAATLGEGGSTEDLGVLTSLLYNENPLSGGDDQVAQDNANADVRSSAAFGVLRIRKRFDRST